MKINKVAEILFNYDLNNPIVYSVIMIDDMQRWTDEGEWETLKSVKQLVKNLKYLEEKYNTKFDYESLKSLKKKDFKNTDFFSISNILIKQFINTFKDLFKNPKEVLSKYEICWLPVNNYYCF